MGWVKTTWCKFFHWKHFELHTGTADWDKPFVLIMCMKCDKIRFFAAPFGKHRPSCLTKDHRGIRPFK